jgi:hypothetical protein
VVDRKISLASLSIERVAELIDFMTAGQAATVL